MKDYISMAKFTALGTGKMSEFRIKGFGSGYVRLGLYADSSGEPGALLNKVDDAPIISGWNTISFPTTAITKDAAYWLAYMSNTDNITAWQDATSEPKRFKALAYSSGLPSPAGSGYSSAAGNDINAAWGILIVSPSGLSQPIAYGSPKLNLSIKPPGYQQLIAYGDLSVIKAGLFIYPSGLQVILAYGQTSLTYPQTISPAGYQQVIAYGQPSVGGLKIIYVPGHQVVIGYGTPTVLKYVYHVILDGRYRTESPDINRTFVIARDDYGNPVWGEAHDTTESALVGQRLDFQQELAVPTTSQAEATANAILSKMRLTKARGIILIPPNCGQELFDTVELSDAGANQSAVKFRVVGIRFEYNPKQAKYQHRLILGAP